jgi:soluble lytic murein transglycosylase
MGSFMISKELRNLLAALALAVAPLAAAAANDDAVLGAYDAYRAGDALKFARFAKKLEGHLLDPWIDYWRIAMRLEDTPTKEVQAFFEEHANTYVAEVLRGDWLKVLGKRGDWPEFERQLALYPREDLEVRCYAWLMALGRGESGGTETSLAEADWVWLEPQELPEGCAKLVQQMLDDGRVTVTDVWRRVRLLFARGQITAAKTTLGYLEKADSPDERMLAEAARQPKRLLERLPKSLERRAAREVVVLALVRYARNDPEAAARMLETRLASNLPEADVRELWGRIAYEAAREHHPEALKWFAHAGTRLDDDQLAWKVRAALRAGRWAVVRDTIDLMSATTRHEPAWT